MKIKNVIKGLSQKYYLKEITIKKITIIDSARVNGLEKKYLASGYSDEAPTIIEAEVPDNA